MFDPSRHRLQESDPYSCPVQTGSRRCWALRIYRCEISESYGRRKITKFACTAPHNKTPSHSRVHVSEMSEQSSQIKEKRTKRISPRESPTNKRTKAQGPHTKQNTTSCKQRRIENYSRKAWYCFMCDDIVKEDIIKHQACLGWAYSACACVGWTFFETFFLYILKVNFC